MSIEGNLIVLLQKVIYFKNIFIIKSFEMLSFRFCEINVKVNLTSNE